MANDIAAWYDEYGPMVIRRCWWMLSPETYRDAKAGRFDKAPDDVKDAVQKVFLKLLEVEGNIKYPDKPSDYIYDTATTVCLNILKSKKGPAGSARNPFSLENVPDGEVPGTDDNDEQVAKELLTRAVKALLEKERNEKMRIICKMYYFEKKGVNEIMKKVKLKKSRVYKIIGDFEKKARSKLGRINMERIKE